MSGEEQLSLLAGHGFEASDPPPGSSDEWYTPTWFFGPLQGQYGYNLDVCATKESAKCARYFDYLADGLAQSWAGAVWWCNPPYSDITPWVERAWAMAQCSPFGTLLLPAWTDRAWWQLHVEPYRDVEAGDVRPVRTKDGGWTYHPARPWASLRCEFGPRIPFGFPGDPEGLSTRARADGAKIYPVLLHWRSTK